MQHKVVFTERAKAELAKLDRDVATKLWQNFIKPIQDGYTPPDELQGKYKPSWECQLISSPMKQAFIKTARESNLYHYHFGYKLYFEGRDPKYDGDVSDGIVHTRIEIGTNTTTHVILETCLTHPSPFKFPFERANDPAKE